MTGPDFSMAVWRKSSRSGSSNGGGGTNCVEVACGGETIGIRDSKYPSAGLEVERATFAAFLTSAKKFH